MLVMHQVKCIPPKQTIHLVNRPLSDLEPNAIEPSSDFVVLGVEPKVSHVLSRCSTIQLHLQSLPEKF